METSVTASRDLEFAIKWNRLLLRLIGVWPDQENFKNDNRKLKINFILATLFMLSFITIPQTVSLIMVWGNLKLIIENLHLANIPITIALLKLLVVWYNGKVLKLLFGYVIEDWMNPKSDREREVMLRNAKIARILCISCFCMIEAALTVHISIHIIANYYSAENSANVTRQMFYQSYFPYDAEKSPNFELTYLGQCIASLYASFSYSGIDTFLAMLILHLCAQFNNLCFALKHLVSKVEREEKVMFRNELAVIVNKHQRLLRFAALIEKSFNLMLLVQILASSLQLCFQGYQIISIFKREQGQFSFSQLAFLISFILSMGLQLFVYCYVGQNLMSESTKLSYAVYQCDWYKLAVQDARDLLLVMLRAKTPLEITAGKFCSFSFSLFCDIVKNSVGYMSVLLAVKEQSDK